jgi:hypothetical protein
MAIPNELTRGSRGAEYWRATVAAFVLDPKDEPVLLEVCRTLDELDQMKAALDADGPMTVGSTGQMVVHPAMASMRAHRLVLDKLLVLLALPDDAGATPPTILQRRAKHAAAVRWKGHVKDDDETPYGA